MGTGSLERRAPLRLRLLAWRNSTRRPASVISRPPSRIVLHEASDTEVLIIHIPGTDMLADPFTKYLKYETWRRHMKVLLNRPEAF